MTKNGICLAGVTGRNLFDSLSVHNTMELCKDVATRELHDLFPPLPTDEEVTVYWRNEVLLAYVKRWVWE
jgi:hypothetical protein